jgi:hypothetical protein
MKMETIIYLLTIYGMRTIIGLHTIKVKDPDANGNKYTD